MDNKDFYTFSEYMKKEQHDLTASMEDYLEMIYRLSQETGFTRINELSNALNVQPPSATKMVQRLAKLKLLKYERYGVIMLEKSGVSMGEALLKRHNTIEGFLRLMGISEKDVLEETEKIEHTLSPYTVKCFEDYLNFCREHPDTADMFAEYRALVNVK